MDPLEGTEMTQIIIKSSDNPLSDYVAVVALIVTIILAVIGWIVSTWLQQKNHKQEQQAKINYDIYAQLVTAHKELQDSIAAFNASTRAPLILMSVELIPLEVRERVGPHAMTPTVSEEECLHKGSVRYSKWLYDDMFAKNNTYIKRLSSFMYLTEDWAAPLAPTNKAIGALREELSRLNALMTTHKAALQNYPRTNGDDWRTWDEADVYAHGDAISTAVITVSSYVSDYMVLVHNELLAPYYQHSRLVRKTYDDTLRVITKDGLVTRIEDDPDIRAAVEEVIRRNAPQ